MRGVSEGRLLQVVLNGDCNGGQRFSQQIHAMSCEKGVVESKANRLPLHYLVLFSADQRKLNETKAYVSVYILLIFICKNCKAQIQGNDEK